MDEESKEHFIEMEVLFFSTINQSIVALLVYFYYKTREEECLAERLTSFQDYYQQYGIYFTCFMVEV